MVPLLLRKKCLLSELDILLDNDTYSRELYDLNDVIEAYVDTEIARIVIDMNRDQTDLPPVHPDGVVKTVTVTQQRVWDSPSGLDE